MSRAYSALVTRLMVLAFLAVLVCAAPAVADTYVTWNLSGVNLSYIDDGVTYTGTVVGNFTIDATILGTGPPYNAYAVSSENITVSGDAVTHAGGVSGFVFSPSSVLVAFVGGGGENGPDLYLSAGTLSNGTYDNSFAIYQLVLAVVARVGHREVFGGTTPLVLSTSGYGSTSNLEITPPVSSDPQAFITSGGTLVPTPLPPSAFLLGTGLLGLVGIRRFRKG